MTGHLLSRARQEHEPWGIGLFLRGLWHAVRAPFVWLRRRQRVLRLRRSGVDRARWWHNRVWVTVATWLTCVLALVFLVWLARAVYVLQSPGTGADRWPAGFAPDSWCAKKDEECGAITGWATSLLSIALASAVFVIWRLTRLRRHYRRTARRHPRDLVPTAGSFGGRIVGRDQLCQAVMEDLRLRPTRRPHVLVGGVGTGKTAVLVRMTELLARRRAVPVPVRLRQAGRLDFEALAQQQFLAELSGRLSSSAEGEKVWRRLRQDGRIVVLADGLEEALVDAPGDGPVERDTEIRNAIRAAHKQRLPLLITSRPHTPLRGTDASIHELEPLSEVDALSYIKEDTLTEDDWRLSWIVEKAGVAEAPLYLQITRELVRRDMLDQVTPREAQVQRPSYDRATLRLRLLQAWEEALVRGRLHPEVPLSRADREITLDWMSAFACAGLRQDSIEVALTEPLPEAVVAEVKRRIRAVSRRPGDEPAPGARSGLTAIDPRLAVTWAGQLGLIEPGVSRVRFQHSLIQAYLGSRLMAAAISDSSYLREALTGRRGARSGTRVSDRDPDPERPGRELLAALVLHSRDATRSPRAAPGPSPARPLRGQPPGPGRQPARRHLSNRQVTQRLVAAAGRHKGSSKALDLYAAAVEISGTQPGPRPGQRPGQRPAAVIAAELPLATIAGKIKASWAQIQSDDLRTLEDAKIGLVRRFGEALRTRYDPARPAASRTGYAELYDICCAENSYRVRLAAAQQIGLGGCPAYQALGRCLARPASAAWLASAPGGGPGGGPEAGRRWARQLTAWVLPLLVTSVDPDRDDRKQDTHRASLRADLSHWLAAAGPGGGLTISEEIALAQGFKYAANRRHRHLHTRPEGWSYLEDQALELLRRASYWFSQLTLIQSLTLWALPEWSDPLAAAADADEPGPPGRAGLGPDQTVERWLDIIGDRPPGGGQRAARPVHQFVEAAADLANRALVGQQPARFVWMDESDAVSRVGAGQLQPPSPSARRPAEWIPPSAGWSALDREAQQLLGDVLVLLNLAERGDDAPSAIEGRLARLGGNQLPPCMTRDRRPLEPLHTIGTAQAHRPGSSCLDGCRFQLCPYPPKGLQHHRAELGEEFCRRQYRLERCYLKPGRHTARWQGMWAGRLRAFWSQMADRARSSPGAPGRS